MNDRDSRSITGHPGTAVVVLLASADHVILIRQFRRAHGIEFLELPGGLIEPGESPAEAMARETLEETGYVVSASVGLGVYATTVGYSDERVQIFAGRVGSRPPDDVRRTHDGRESMPITMTIDHALDLLRSSPVGDLKTLAGLLLYATQRAQIWRRLSATS